MEFVMPIVDGQYVAPDVDAPGPSMKEESVTQQVAALQADPTPLHQSLVETMRKLDQKVDSSVSMSALIADPNIRAYLEAKAQGKNVQIAEVKPPVQEETKLPEDFENLSNADLTKFLTTTIAKQTEGMLKNFVEQQMNAVRQEFGQKIDGLNAIEGKRQQDAVINQLEELKAKHPDFEQMKPIMAEINQKTQGLNASQLYFLAKLQQGVPAVTQNEISSERPGTIPGGQSVKGPKLPQNTRGAAGFRSLLAAALK